MLGLLHACLDSIGEQVAFAKTMADSFSAEFGLGPDSFKGINQYYKQFDFDEEAVPGKLANLSNRYFKLAGVIFSSCDQQQRVTLLADMIHIHINRLLIADQRQHEAVLYHFLVKVLQRRFMLASKSKV